MAEMSYTYHISEDFLNHTVSPSSLSLEIQESSITAVLDHIDTDDDICNIWFINELVAEEQSILNAIIAEHDGYDVLPFTHIIDPTVNDDETKGNYVGERWINITDGIEFVCLDATIGAALWRLSSVPIHYNVEHDTTFGTTDLEFTTATQLTTGPVAQANYKAQWSFEALTEIGTVVHAYRIILDLESDGYSVLAENDLEFENSSTVVPVSGFANLTLIPGSHTITLQIKAYDGESEVKVRRRRIDLRRIEYGTI